MATTSKPSSDRVPVVIHPQALEAIGGGGRIGSRALVHPQPPAPLHEPESESEVPAGLEPAVEGVDDEPPPVRSGVHWLFSLLNNTVLPALQYAISEALIKATPEQYQPLVVIPARLLGTTVIQPTLQWLMGQLEQLVTDPAAFTKKTKKAVKDAWGSPAAVRATLAATLPTGLPNKTQIGNASRRLFLGASQAAGQALLENLAGRMGESPLAQARVRMMVPMFGMAINRIADLGLDVVYPMTYVDPADVPAPQSILRVCTILPTQVVSAAARFDGYYDVSVDFADTGMPWLAVTGKAKVRIGPEGRVAQISNLVGAKLTIGTGKNRYALGKLESNVYGEYTGWSLGAGEMLAIGDNNAPATLERLLISPIGWVDGSFARDRQRGVLGGKAPDGVRWPLEAIRSDADDEIAMDDDAPAPGPVEADGGVEIGDRGASTLSQGIHEVLSAERGKWAIDGLLRGAMIYGGWFTSHQNLLRPGRPAPARPALTPPPMGLRAKTEAWLRAIDPFGMLDHLAHINLVPAFLSSGFPKLSFVANRLEIGREPSLAFGMSTSLQLFAEMPTLAATGVTVAWLPFEKPAARLRANAISFGTNLVLDGVELDPDGGVRTAHASLGLPLPGPFSIQRVVAQADYLTVGHGIDFRNGNVAAKGIKLADVITIDSLGLGVTDGGKRFTVTVDGGKVELPDAQLAFDGSVSWGASQPVAGRGKVTGGPLSTADGQITATALTGALDVADREVRGKVSATALTFKWKQYTLTTTADVTIDRRGLAAFEIAELTVKDNGVVVGTARGVEYVRGKTLVIGAFSLTVPETGELRGTREDPRGPAPQLAVTNLDLSSLVRAPDSPDAPKSTPAPAPKPGLSATNLGKLELGPPGAPPFLALDFTKVARDKVDKDAEAGPAGTIAAVVSGDLRAFEISPRILMVGPSATSERDFRVSLAGVSGTGFHLTQATYDAGRLEVIDATAKINVLLGAFVPDALRKLDSTITTSFVVDTRAGRLESLSIRGELSGTLFDDAVTIKKATATLRAKPGKIAAGALADGLTLDGEIAVEEVTAKAYGTEATLTGSIRFPSGLTTLSGTGTAGDVTAEIRGARFGGGKPTFEYAKVSLGAPASDLVKFVKRQSTLVLDEADYARVVVIATRAQVDPSSGLPEHVVSEQVTVERAPSKQPAPSTPTPTPTPSLVAPSHESSGSSDGGSGARAIEAQVARTSVDVHLPQINIGNGALVVTADDVHGATGEGTERVTLRGAATLKVGPLNGGVAGSVSMALPRASAEPSGDSQAPKKTAATPDADSVVLEVASARLGSYELDDLRYERERLTIKRAKAPVAALLGAFPVDLGLHETRWTMHDVDIDLRARTLRVGGMGMVSDNVTCLDGGLTIASVKAIVGLGNTALDGGSLIASPWGLTLTAADAKLAIVDGLSIGGSGQLVINRSGFQSGTLTGATVAWGVGSAGVGAITFTADGWTATDVFVDIDPSAAKLGFLGGSLTAGFPPWLSALGAYRVRATFPLSRAAKKIHWPTFDQIKMDIRKAGLKLPGGIAGEFDRGTKRASVKAKPPKGVFSASAQIPFAQGIGLEISGSLEHQIEIEANDVTIADGDDLAFNGKLAATADVKGRVRVGLFGGVPSIFTVSAGVYAGLDLHVAMSADATGAWKLPKTPGGAASGDVQLYLSMLGKEGAASIVGEAGAYASIKVLGFGRTIEKPLVRVKFAEILAHGFAKLDTTSGLTLLPAGGFPAHVLRLEPTLEKYLMGGDTEKAMLVAQNTVERGVGKVQASEELLATEPAKRAAPEATPWKSDKATLDTERDDAIEVFNDARESAKGTKLLLETDRDCLSAARVKLANHEKKLTWLKGKPTRRVKGRAVGAADLQTRLRDYKTMQGLVAETTKLDAVAMQLKITYKKEEIAEFERKIPLDEARDLATRQELATASTAKDKATRKADLADNTKAEVESDLARRQRRLMAMYGQLQAAHAKAHEQDARRAGKLATLAADQVTAEKRLDTLKARDDASPTERTFWAAQIEFLVEEQKRIKVQVKPAEMTLPPETSAALDRAKLAQPGATEKLSERVNAELEALERTIGKLTLDLTANFGKLEALPEIPTNAQARGKLEKKRTELLAELEGEQVKLAGAFQRAAALA